MPNLIRLKSINPINNRVTVSATDISSIFSRKADDEPAKTAIKLSGGGSQILFNETERQKILDSDTLKKILLSRVPLTTEIKPVACSKLYSNKNKPPLYVNDSLTPLQFDNALYNFHENENTYVQPNTAESKRPVSNSKTEELDDFGLLLKQKLDNLLKANSFSNLTYSSQTEMIRNRQDSTTSSSNAPILLASKSDTSIRKANAENKEIRRSLVNDLLNILSFAKTFSTEYAKKVDHIQQEANDLNQKRIYLSQNDQKIRYELFLFSLSRNHE
jgi:hypothetical protein